MENNLYVKDYLRTALQFSYALPFGAKVKGLEDVSIKMVSVFCKPDFEDALQFSFSLFTSTVGSLFFDAFDDTPIANASALTMSEVEQVIRARIADGLCGTGTFTLSESTLHAVCGYHIPPAIAGTKGVRLLLKCYSPRMNEYKAETNLYVNGIEIGIVDEKTLHGVAMTFRGFAERADIIAESIAEDNFKELVLQMLMKYKAEHGKAPE